MIDIAPADDLVTLPERINSAVQAAESHARSAVECAIRAGGLLLQAKALVRHGEWETWLQEHVTCAPRTAQAYMRLHAKVKTLPKPEAQRVALLPLRDAMKAIATEPKQESAGQRSPYMRFRTRSEAERVNEALLASATHIRQFARYVRGNYIKRKDYERLRKELQGTLAALDAFADGADGAQTLTQVTVSADDVRPLLDKLDAEFAKHPARATNHMTDLCLLMHVVSTESERGLARARAGMPTIADQIYLRGDGREILLNRAAILNHCNALIELGKVNADRRDSARAAAAARELRNHFEVVAHD
ncbi:MAG: DUF3102 domain-containing protein [Burkholderiaceae bacterium]|nr:DUF3102 domain-containing protein [Burkholderiaceae bacterium]